MAVGLLAGIALLTACTTSRPVSIPMRTVRDSVAAPQSPPADTLVVLLPGVYDTPEDFQRSGFVTAVRARHLPVDLILADAHLGYYSDHTLIARLREDIIAPARRTYRHVWLLGISLGGFGALAYAMEHPGDVDGLLLIAPYLGNRGIQQEILVGGGLDRWQPGPLAADDSERRLWRWLADRTAAGHAARPTIWLGYGRDDRFAAAHRMLAGTLPPAHTTELPGGHDWTTWRHLWDAFLDREVITAGGSSPSSATVRRPPP